MMCVYCCSIEIENHLQTVTTVDSVYLRYVTLLTLHSYLLSHVTLVPWTLLTAAVKDKRKTQNLTRVTVTLRYQNLPADSDRNQYTHTLIDIKHKRTYLIRQLINLS